jgi:nucleotide-binding universal stress UspA family protein
MRDHRLRVLVPLDGTSESEGVLPALLPLFRNQTVRLTLLGVSGPAASAPDLDVALSRLRTSLLMDGVTSESRVATGEPAEEILRAGRPAEFDLIAMATHGRTGLHRDLVGSLTETVLRGSGIPVLAFRHGTKIGDWKRMVVALDGSPTAEAALADAAQLARAMGATLHLVRVKGTKPKLLTHPGLPFPVPEGDPQTYLEGIADGLAAKQILALPTVRVGEPAEEILAVAKEVGAGLICLSTHGRTGLSRVLLGSVAESVLRAAPCPVLLRRTVGSASPVEPSRPG